MQLRTIKEANVTNKRVLVRVDYNVSLDKKGNVADDTRITQTLPTINYLTGKKAKVILTAHLGRPGGKPDKRLSFKNVTHILAKHLNKKVTLIDNFWDREAILRTQKINFGEVAMLENIRFHPGETINDRSLARHIASMADQFVYDAFGTAHRAHASTVGIAAYLPSYAGLLLEREIKLINRIIAKDNKKLSVIIGGAKTPEKIRVINKLLEQTYSILLGGAVANTFLSTWGIPTGVSKVDYEMIEMARQVIWKATQVNSSLLLPVDVVISNSQKTSPPKIISYENVPGHRAIFDIGKKTIRKYEQTINSSDKIIWNGPMGLYEDKRFINGTNRIFSILTKHKGLTLIGGGDTISALSENKKSFDKITHISTGGGALLEYLEKGTLPGIEIVKR